jgi:hypothetical protein
MHKFWEIQDGRYALLWEDSYQQLPSLQSNPGFDSLKGTLQTTQGK